MLLRKKFSKGGSWYKISKVDREQLKAGCLSCVQAEPERTVRLAVAQLVGTLARHELAKKGGGWSELFTFLLAKLESVGPQDRVLGSLLLSVLAETAGDQLVGKLKELLQLCRKTLADSEAEVCYYTIVTLTHLVRRTGSEEVNIFQQLVPTVLTKIEALAAADQEKALLAIDIFDELIESEVGIVIPHIKPMVELCIRLAQASQLEDGLRVKAITFMGRLTRLKKKTIVKHKLYIQMIQVLFSVMAAQELPDDDEDDEDAEDESSPCLAATQTIDILALNLPPEKFMSALLSHVQPALASAEPAHQRAGYQALALSAEGCQEHIRTKYLNNMLMVLSNGIKHEQPAVRNAAFYMLGQYSEYIQPELSDHAKEILPALLEFLDRALASLTPGTTNSPTSLSRIFYALETFCENLEAKLVPHLEQIMTRVIRVLNDQFSVRVQELAISLIGAAATATKGAIVPYLGEIMPRLENYLSREHTADTQVLLTQSMATLATLARAVGEQHFSKEFAEKSVSIGLELVKNNDDPDVRKCAYSLFGSVATVVKSEMGAGLIGVLVEMMLTTIQNQEGLSLDMEDNDTNIPLEELSDEEDIEEDGDENDKNQDDMEGVKGVSIQNSYIEEKECALVALKDLSTECGPAFFPYLGQVWEEVSTLLDCYLHELRAAAIEACGHFLVAYNNVAATGGEDKFRENLPVFLDQMVSVVKEEEEHQVVIAALDILGHLLKECKGRVTENPKHINKIISCVEKIMKGECACQDVELDEEDEEEAEQDEMLFEYAGEILPNLGRALTPNTFCPHFTKLLPMLLKKTKKSCSISERSFALGAIADSIEPLTGMLGPFLPKLLAMFGEMCSDSEEDCRNNAVFGLGELMLWGGQDMLGHRQQILQSLEMMMKVE